MTEYLVKGGAMILDLLMMVFILSLSMNMIRGVDISCGCFSNSLVVTGHMLQYLMRDIILLFIGSWVLYFKIKKEKIVSPKGYLIFWELK